LFSQRITILVGTMTGTAEQVAAAIARSLESRAKVEVHDMERLTPAVFDADAIFVICSSTYGHGDVPDNAWELYRSLIEDRPALGHVRYGVVALGDRTHAGTFCNGGRRFDAILAELGAVRLGEIFCHDASTGSRPEDEASAWAAQWLSTIAVDDPALERR
jgi:MioC protein